MNATTLQAHRIMYDVLSPGQYQALCLCGQRKQSGSTDLLSAWGQAHVVKAWEATHRR